MRCTPVPEPVAPEDRSRTALDFVHALMVGPPREQGLDALLVELACAFGADGAGLAAVAADGAFELRHRARVPAAAARLADPAARWPWDEEPGLPAKVSAAAAPVPVHRDAGGAWLVTGLTPADGVRWLLWLEDAARCAWSPAESAALALAGHALAHAAQEAPGAPLWARQIEPARRRQRLEQTVAVVQRLAHDFGNFLTSIQGFTELALLQLPRESPAYGHLTEVLRAALEAGSVTERLRLFSRRGAAPVRSTPLTPIVAQVTNRLRESWGPSVRLRVEVPDHLPPARIDSDSLREVLDAVLENAREAIAGAGSITVAARSAALTAADCLGLFGNPAAGPCVEITVSDTGCGIAPEVHRRLLAEPFFSSKPRHRGLGLAVVHGVLHPHRGGFRLDPGPERGTVVRLFLSAAGDWGSGLGKENPGHGGEECRGNPCPVLGAGCSSTLDPQPPNPDPQSHTVTTTPASRGCQDSPRINPVPRTSATHRP